MSVSLKSFLRVKEKEFAKLGGIVAMLKTTKVPISVNCRDGNDFCLYSEDYALARDFKIQKRNIYLGGTSGYDGGYSTYRHETYPRFYFNLKYKGLTKPVYIQHDGFDEDSRVVIKSITETRGYKDYASESGTSDCHIDIEKVFAFFRERGVNERLLGRLDRRIKMAEEF